jgi:phosphoacetylglucosamine mutase
VDPDKDVLKKFASIDGDADRVVYFYVDNEKRFCLLDGDKIIALVATYLQNLTKEARLNLHIGTFYENPI